MILCCGEALIDMLPRTTSDGLPAFAPHPGGAVFNTAIALGRLGPATGFLSGLSTDLFGRVLTEALDRSGVDASFAARSDRPTTLAFVELSDGQARYEFYDENTAGRLLSDADLSPLPASVTALFFGGISLMVEPCGGTYETLALREAGRRAVMLDPNIRPGFIGDVPRYRNRLARMIAAADIVKISDEDLRWLAGETDPADAARDMLARGPRLICVTEGPRGVRALTAEGEVRVDAPSVKVADTVGAGDTFNAGLLAGLEEAGMLAPGLPGLTEPVLRDALCLGVRVAAVTVARAGANPPFRKEVPCMR